MEWSVEARVNLRESDLQRELRIDTLPQWCDAVEEVLSCKGDKGRVRCVFGEQLVHREMIAAGVRFTLPLSGEALQWTVTADIARHGAVLLHCTSNRGEHDAAWMAKLERFLEGWRRGLESWPARLLLKSPEDAGSECEPGFSGFG